jgi:hypothetical protein
MAEYEIFDLINGVNSNIFAGQAIFLTTLSAYLVVAYSVGKALTPYQVGFINVVFLLMMFVGFNAQIALLGLVYGLSEQLASVTSYADGPSTTAEVVRIVFTGIRLVMVVGAIVFMWQVRHPKTE